MLVKINSRGSGGGRGPTEYLTGDYGTVTNANGDAVMPTAAQRAEGVGLRSVKPVVLRGDARQTRELIDSLSFKQKYTSGVLSFEEPNMTPQAKAEIMESWESAIFPGMEKDQYQVLWVEHRDKGRLELNFLIPNVELDSGKRLQPYFDKADRNRVDAWQTLTNDRHSLSDPKEPVRARLLIEPADLPKDAKNAKQAITRGLLALGVESRAEVVQALTDAGYEISRDPKKSISVKLTPDAHPLRLSGAIYEETYRGGSALRAERERAEESHTASRESRISEAEQRYRIGIDKRREYLRERYQRPDSPEISLGDIERASVGRVVGAHLRDGPSIQRPDRALHQERHSNSDRYVGNEGLQRTLGGMPHPDQETKQRREGLPSAAGLDDDGVRENPIEFAQGVGRRAQRRKSAHGRHESAHRAAAEADRPVSRIAEASRWLSERVERVCGRVTELAQKVKRELSRSGMGISR